MLIPNEISDLVGTTQTCIELVSPDFRVRPELLYLNGWAYTQPRRVESSEGAFEFVQYNKDGLSIALLDYEAFVLCRTAAIIEDVGQVDELRSALIANLPAAPINEVAGLEGYTEQIVAGAPGTDLDNVLIAGDYMLEIIVDTMDTSKFGSVAASPIVTMAMVSCIPVPSQYRRSAQDAASE